MRQPVARRSQLVFIAIGGVVLVVALAALLIKWAPHWLVSTEGLSPADRVAEVGRVRTALLTLLAGTIAVIGVIYTARTFALNQQGQITERFTRAIDQLGHQQIDVRLGGIYALERIARDSAVDHNPVMEILTGFLRERSRQQAPDDDRKTLATDIQAALSVVARRRVEHDGPPHLDFSHAHLAWGRFYEATLTHADLSFSDLSHANLDAVDLSSASLADAELDSASLIEANLTEASARNASLKRAELHHTNLEGAYLARCDLSDAMLTSSNFRYAYLFRANLAQAYLPDAELQSANLSCANLQDADLVGANFECATLAHANLQGADLGRANLENVVMDGAVYDDKTAWPAGFDPRQSDTHLLNERLLPNPYELALLLGQPDQPDARPNLS
jgi:uncharacterized protein YjbI with pentapeptide repeats